MAVEVEVANQELSQTHNDVKLFNQWSFDDIHVNDMSLVDYIGVAPSKHALPMSPTLLGGTLSSVFEKLSAQLWRGSQIHL